MSTVLVGVLLIASMTAVGTALTVADLHALTRRRTVLAVTVTVNDVGRRVDGGRAGSTGR